MINDIKRYSFNLLVVFVCTIFVTGCTLFGGGEEEAPTDTFTNVTILDDSDSDPVVEEDTQVTDTVAQAEINQPEEDTNTQDENTGDADGQEDTETDQVNTNETGSDELEDDSEATEDETVTNSVPSTESTVNFSGANAASQGQVRGYTFSGTFTSLTFNWGARGSSDEPYPSYNAYHNSDGNLVVEFPSLSDDSVSRAFPEDEAYFELHSSLPQVKVLRDGEKSTYTFDVTDNNDFTIENTVNDAGDNVIQLVLEH